MSVEVLWTPSELSEMQIQDRVAVMVDVLRSSTSIVTAIHNGARAVVPAASVEEALKIARSLGRDGAVLGGERQGVRVPGFELGNSPAEFTTDAIGGRMLVMTTTNGTQTLAALAGTQAVYLAALVNLGAVVGQMAELEGDVLIVCAGRGGRVAAEDAVCAGLMVEAGLEKWGDDKTRLGDGALAALALARQHAPIGVNFLQRTAAGRALQQLGWGEDLELCARIDPFSEVPVLRDRQICGSAPSGDAHKPERERPPVGKQS